MVMAAIGYWPATGTIWSASLLKTQLFNVSAADGAAYSAAMGVILLDPDSRLDSGLAGLKNRPGCGIAK
jgi:hypothetical protein